MADAIDLVDRIALIRNDVAIIDAALHAPEVGGMLDRHAATGLRCLCERIMDELAGVNRVIKPEK